MKYEITPVLQAWNLSDVRSFDHIIMSNNFVMKAYSHEYGCDVVLKIGPKQVIDREVIALKYFQGEGCVKLLKVDEHVIVDSTVLLLEYIQPGTTLKDLYEQGQEDQSLEIFIELMRTFHRTPINLEDQQKYAHVQTVAQKLSFLDTFQSQDDQLQKLLPQAIVMKNQLVATQGQLYFLHGDLHHENILKRKPDGAKSEGRKDHEYVMIDPQGIIGELCYEISAFLYNPVVILLEHKNLIDLITHRFDRLHEEFGFDRSRMIGWSFVRSVLAACYYEEDNQDEQDEKTRYYFLEFALFIAHNFLKR